MRILRVGGPNMRVTRGKVYSVGLSGHITDDSGRIMKPKMPRKGFGKNKWWEILNSIDAGSEETNNEETNEKEVTKMLNMKEAFLINGVDSDEKSAESIITLIEREEQMIARLDGIIADSKAIHKLKAKHRANIAALVKVIDSREG